MQSKIFPSAVTLVCAGSLLLASCSAPPSQTTTINVEVPDSSGAKKGADEVEVKAPEKADGTDADKPAVEIARAKPQVGAQPAAKPAQSSRPKKLGLLDYYDRVPAEHFVAFGGANRRSLLGRKGAVVDYKRNFIEIPGSADERDGDLELLQISIFPNGSKPWVGVSRVVWPRGQTPGNVAFYQQSGDGGLRQTSAGFFPYKLKRVDGAYESALLPRKGLDVMINSAQDSETNGPIFRYSSKKWTGTPFTELNEAQYAEYEGGY